MHAQPNETHAHEAPVDGLVRTPYTLVVCVVCGDQRIHAGCRRRASCPVCRSTARRTFVLYRDRREGQ